jgi:hypothetical protein
VEVGAADSVWPDTARRRRLAGGNFAPPPGSPGSEAAGDGSSGSGAAYRGRPRTGRTVTQRKPTVRTRVWGEKRR